MLLVYHILLAAIWGISTAEVRGRTLAIDSDRRKNPRKNKAVCLEGFISGQRKTQGNEMIIAREIKKFFWIRKWSTFASLLIFSSSLGTMRHCCNASLVFVVLLFHFSFAQECFSQKTSIPRGSNSKGKDQIVAEFIKLETGSDFMATADGETKITYHVHVPKSYNPDELPAIIIGFSPGGDGKSMVKAVAESCDKRGWVAIGCNELKNKMNNQALETKMMKEVLDDIFKKIPHDSKRIFLAGFSGGAMRAYEVSAIRAETIAGIIAYGGWIGGEERYKLDFCKGMAIAIVNGKDDSGANSWSSRDEKVLSKRKCRVKMFQFNGGHEIPPPESTEEAFLWIEEAPKSKNKTYKNLKTKDK